MPNADSSPDTKERLLRVALELLAESGQKSLTIRNIAQRAGIAISVVHHHYINKDGLLDACKEDFYRRLGEVAAELVAATAGASNDDLVEKAVRAFWSFARDNVPMLRLLAGDSLRRGELIRSVGSYETRPLGDAVIKVLAPRFGLSEPTARARVQSMSTIATRFAVSTERELCAVFGGEPETALKAAEEELVATAKLLFLAKYSSAAEA